MGYMAELPISNLSSFFAQMQEETYFDRTITTALRHLIRSPAMAISSPEDPDTPSSVEA
jgi:hypothetical protein